MPIRVATIDDAAAIMHLHTRSVRQLCAAAYTAEQIESWVGKSSLGRFRFRLEKNRTFVSESGHVLTGYARWNPATNELCSIFVNPDFARQGIGSQLMATMRHDALAMGVERLWLDASLNALPFYKQFGCTVEKEGMHGTLPCVRMIYLLT